MTNRDKHVNRKWFHQFIAFSNPNFAAISHMVESVQEYSMPYTLQQKPIFYHEPYNWWENNLTPHGHHLRI